MQSMHFDRLIGFGHTSSTRQTNILKPQSIMAIVYQISFANKAVSLPRTNRPFSWGQSVVHPLVTVRVVPVVVDFVRLSL